MATNNQAGGNTQHEIPVHTQGRGDGVMAMPLANIHAPSTTKKTKDLAIPGPALPLEAMMDVPVTLVFEVCRIEIDIQQLLSLATGSHLELRQVSVDTIDIRLNETVIAYGETIALKQRYGVRWGELETFLGKGDEDVQ